MSKATSTALSILGLEPKGGATPQQRYCLPSDLPLQTSEPQFKNGSVYGENTSTRLDKIKNFHIDPRAGPVGDAEGRTG